MKRFLLSLAVSLLLYVPCFATNPAIEKAHQASYHIAQDTLAKGPEFCSATAVGPQALLTATHCEAPTDYIEIDGQAVSGTAIIVDRIRDGFDHTIYLVKNITFPDYVSVIEKKPDLGDDVFSFGNPGDWIDVFQKGYIAAVEYDQSPQAQFGGGKPPEVLIDIQAFPGSSGSGVFNTDGAVVFVVTAYDEQSKDGSAIAFALAYPLHFSQEELDKARMFTHPADPKPAPKKTPEKK